MKTKKYYTLFAALALSIGAFFVASSNQVDASNSKAGSIGVDLAKYQGSSGRYTSIDKFSIVQIGGTYGGTYIDNPFYSSQVNYAKKHGYRVHNYLWYGVGGSSQLGVQAVNHYLKKVKTPKGSIIALDYEDGASWSVSDNTSAILAGMRRIKSAGYAPMYYSYKPYTLAHVDYNRILKAYPTSIWIAGYPDYNVRAQPLWAYFPSLNGVAIWQFTSTHAAGGLDGNVDLTGITYSGYSSKHTKKTVTLKPLVVQDVYKKSQVRLLNSKGYTNRYASYGSKWSTAQSKTIRGKVCFNIGKNLWLPAKYTNFSVVQVNYLPRYGVNAVNSKGRQIKGTNKTFKTGTRWRVCGIAKIKKQWAFLIGRNTYLQYQYIHK